MPVTYPDLNRVSVKKRTGAHFTPDSLARLVARRLIAQYEKLGEHPLRILDPACGDGALLRALAELSHEAPIPTNKQMLIGVDTNLDDLKTAESRISAISRSHVALIQGDFLAISAGLIAAENFFDKPCLPAALQNPVDVIIANPPYVRTQILGSRQSQRLAKTFNLTGRVDLYHAFVVAMTRCLKPGGLLGIIMSNRFLVTKGSASLRNFMLQEYDIIEIMDLGDTKLFEAAVLPAIVVARRKTGFAGRQNNAAMANASFVRIYEHLDSASVQHEFTQKARSVYDLLENPRAGAHHASGKVYNVALGAWPIPSSTAEPWTLVTRNEGAWLDRINSNAVRRIADVAKVKVGIKTTADSIFIRSDWKTLPKDLQPESSLLRPLLSHDVAAKWCALPIDSATQQVLYTHEIRNASRSPINLHHFPRASRYLESHKAHLTSRKYVLEAGRRWFEIWVPQDPAAWQLPKLVFPDISPTPKFFYDCHGSIVNGDCYWLTLRPGYDDDLLFLILGIANSNLITRYHDLSFNNKLYSGRRRYLTQYVERYPLPDPQSNASRAVVSLVRNILDNTDTMGRREALERRLEEAVTAAFGI